MTERQDDAPGGGDRPLRVALFGSPRFAVPTLEALTEHHTLVLVVAQPDKPAGRGLRLRSPATAERARALGIPVAQPPRLKGDLAFERALAELGLDVAVTAAYGKILPGPLLAIPANGFLNVHASLLPKYRGAAPVQWAVARGERETGVSIMQTEVGLDTGPVRHVRRTAVGDDETAPELLERLALLGADALIEALALLRRGRLPSWPQDDDAASHAPMLTTEDGRIRFEDPARAVYDRFRGVAGWPGSHFEHRAERVKVSDLRPTAATDGAAPGTVLALGGEGVRVACGDGAVTLRRVKPPGRAEMAARDWANGRRIHEGDHLG